MDPIKKLLEGFSKLLVSNNEIKNDLRELKESKLNTDAKMAELQWQIDQQKEENKKIRGEN
jgi:hypothetical protein